MYYFNLKAIKHKTLFPIICILCIISFREHNHTVNSKTASISVTLEFQSNKVQQLSRRILSIFIENVSYSTIPAELSALSSNKTYPQKVHMVYHCWFLFYICISTCMQSRLKKVPFIRFCLFLPLFFYLNCFE